MIQLRLKEGCRVSEWRQNWRQNWALTGRHSSQLKKFLGLGWDLVLWGCLYSCSLECEVECSSYIQFLSPTTSERRQQRCRLSVHHAVPPMCAWASAGCCVAAALTSALPHAEIWMLAPASGSEVVLFMHILQPSSLWHQFVCLA